MDLMTFFREENFRVSVGELCTRLVLQMPSSTVDTEMVIDRQPDLSSELTICMGKKETDLLFII